MRWSSRSLQIFLPLIAVAAMSYGLFMGSLFLGAERVDHAERVRDLGRRPRTSR
jgi:hypothetical protein